MEPCYLIVVFFIQMVCVKDLTWYIHKPGYWYTGYLNLEYKIISRKFRLGTEKFNQEKIDWQVWADETTEADDKTVLFGEDAILICTKQRRSWSFLCKICLAMCIW